MGNPRGFMTVDRRTYSERDPVERIGDWNEFHLDLPVVELQTKGLAVWIVVYRFATPQT